MKANVLELNGKSSRELELPPVFATPLRPDLIRRAYWLVNSHAIQPKGRDPMAGMKTSAETHNPPTGQGISRIPRVKGERYSKSGQAGGVASIVGGRLGHGPRSNKVIYLRINRKERRLALASAIASTADQESVAARGHRIGKHGVPLVVADDLESVSKTSDLISFLEKVGLSEELERLYGSIKRRTGKSRLRGRSYREGVGPLIVVTNDRGVGKTAGSIPGAQVVPASSLNVLQLAPGGVPGRLTLWTESSLSELPVPGVEVEAKIAA
ncbi:MAG: 50S ribosomal protein L4 [Thaumarchaeota archaeon]|nr:50S ribosomal protein L4 [Nitrososphaerota archaeon]